MLKRTFDLIASGIALVLLSPVMLIIALIVKVDSRGPVIYRGIRAGRGNVPFRIFKFRTMIPDAEQMGGPSTAKGDSRVTRSGTFLRRYKLDELPQLINVLRGEMSIVGPRAEVLKYTRLYTGDELLILTVRPGITDYASIKFVHLEDVLGKNDVDRVYEEKVWPVKNALRVHYVRTHCFRRDLSIIFLTLFKLAGISLWNALD